MPKQKSSKSPELKTQTPASLGVSALIVIGVLLALPISQLIDQLTSRTTQELDITDQPPPPDMEEPPPPEEEEEQDEIEDIKEEREPPTLEQLELSMNTDLSAIGNSDFTVPTINVGDQLNEIIYELNDLTRPPRPVARQAPTYPPELRRAGISGTVVLKFVVRADGTTSTISVERSDNPAFDEPAIRAVRRWRFDPGEKDGKPVNVWVRQPIPFNFNR